MSFNSALSMYVVNNTGVPAVFAFSHQYAVPEVHDYPTVSWTGRQPVPPNGFAGPLQVGFSVGLGNPGMDYWYCQALLLAGPYAGSTFATQGSLGDPSKECMCQPADDGMIYYFPFDTSTFVMPLLSGFCTTGVSKQ